MKQLREIAGDLFSQGASETPSPNQEQKKTRPVAKAKTPTKSEIQLIEASASIMESPTGDDMAFMHAIMCQVGLPRAKTEARDFLRKSGDMWIYVQAGMLDEGNGPIPQPVPYGPLPRLATAWLSTYAVRNREQEIPIGHSAAEFLRRIGIDGVDGRRYATLRTQMQALAACRLQLGYKGLTTNPAPVVKTFVAWHQDKDTGQKSLWPGVLRLSDEYFGELLKSAVPLDNRALHALKGSSLALDIYTWLAHRLHRIAGRPITLHWASIREQFAQEYKGKNADKDFKVAFMSALQSVLAVYPQAKVKPVLGGLLLQPSPPPIPYKGA